VLKAIEVVRSACAPAWVVESTVAAPPEATPKLAGASEIAVAVEIDASEAPLPLIWPAVCLGRGGGGSLARRLPAPEKVSDAGVWSIGAGCGVWQAPPSH
jgi:hypothetical protein